MKQVTVRVSEDSLSFVRHQARARGLSESEMWRQLIEVGMQRSDVVVGRLESACRLIIQSLCMSQRVADHLNKDLVAKARDDARLLIARMESAQAMQDEG